MSTSTIRKLGSKNKMFRSFIEMGYYGTAVLPVVVRNVLENPAWYTSIPLPGGNLTGKA
ncbi:MAG: hypothetical protein R2744_07970 [Bacteroidales bacterium]